MRSFKKGYCIRLTSRANVWRLKDRIKYIGPVDGDIYVSAKEVKKQLDRAEKYYGEKYICDVVQAKVMVSDKPMTEEELCAIIQQSET